MQLKPIPFQIPSDDPSMFSLSLRARQHCFARLRVAFMAAGHDQFLYPHILIARIVIYTVARPVYERFVSKAGSVTELVQVLRTKPGGNDYLDSRDGTLFETYLMGAKRTDSAPPPELLGYQKLSTQLDSGASFAEARNLERAKDIFNFYHDMQRRRGEMPVLSAIVKLIEVGAPVEAQ